MNLNAPENFDLIEKDQCVRLLEVGANGDGQALANRTRFDNREFVMKSFELACVHTVVIVVYLSCFVNTTMM